jgi:hypothetical protein
MFLCTMNRDHIQFTYMKEERVPGLDDAVYCESLADRMY